MDSKNTDETKTTNESPEISSDLIRGHINTIILRTLYDNDKYGYEIINEIEEKSKGQYSLKQPTLYSALKRLETQDYVTSYWGGASGGGRRKYFQITDKGKAIVEQNLAEWEYSRTVIDSLISNRDFDFDNPPPTASVDFNILKQSTTRVPVSHPDSKEEPTEQEQPKATIVEETKSEEPILQSSAEEAKPEEKTSPAEDEQYVRPEPTRPLTDEERQRIHDNYKALIGNKDTAASNFYAQSAGKNNDANSDSQTVEQTAATQAQSAPQYQPNEQQPQFNQQYQPNEQQPQFNQQYQSYEQQPQFNQQYQPYEQQPQFNQQYQPYEQQPQFNQQYQPYEQQPQFNQQYQPYEQQPQFNQQKQNTVADEQEQYSAAYEENRSISSELLYSNKAPAERNYKSLLNKLYDNTQHQAEEMYAQPIPEPQTQTEMPPTEEEAEEQYQPEPTNANIHNVQGASTASNIEFYDVEEKAQKDGLRVTTTNGTRNRTNAKSVGNTFNKGKALLITATYIFFIALAECIASHALHNYFLSEQIYIVIPYVLDFVMLGVFLFMYLGGYGKKARKTKSSSYISASFIIFTNILLIIALAAYFLISAENVDLSVTMQIVKYAVIPVIYAFNLPLFALLYKVNCNRQ